MATQMQRKKIALPPGLLERKKPNKVVSFSTLFFMFTLTWKTEKELGRRISLDAENMKISKRWWENKKC